jgi:hypothetical protein
MNLAGPWQLAEIKPPPVALLAISPMLSNIAPRIATVLPSIFTVFEYPCGEFPDFAIFGNGEGTNGAGGPGILHMLGSVALAMPLEPFVTGVFGGWIDTLDMI